MRVCADFTIDGDFAEIFTAHGEVEDSADADGPEEADEGCLEKVFDLVNVSVEGEDYGHAANKEDEDPEEDEAVEGDYVVVQK